MRKKDKISLIILITIILLVISSIIYSKIQIKIGTKYSIATITDIFWSTGSNFEYIFLYNNNKIKGVDKVPDSKSYNIGERFFVQFSSKNTKISYLIFDPKVPDWLIEVPAEGWDSIPVK